MGDQIYGDGRTTDSVWTHNAMYRWCIIEMYPWNLYNFINQCHPNEFNTIFKKKKRKQEKKAFGHADPKHPRIIQLCRKQEVFYRKSGISERIEQ